MSDWSKAREERHGGDFPEEPLVPPADDEAREVADRLTRYYKPSQAANGEALRIHAHNVAPILADFAKRVREQARRPHGFMCKEALEAQQKAESEAARLKAELARLCFVEAEERFREKVWLALNAYHADGQTLDPERRRLIVRDPNGAPNVYNTLLTILWELFPERMAAAREEAPDGN